MEKRLRNNIALKIFKRAEDVVKLFLKFFNKRQ